MGVVSQREHRLWWIAAAWVVTIDSTLYVARPIAEFLRERDLLRLTVWAVITLLGVAVLAWTVRRRLGRLSLAVLAAGGAAFFYAVRSVSPPEVQLHFVEYGVLGGLFWGAWTERGARFAPLWATAATTACGWLDEAIQYLLPNRFYDLADVAINAVAGALAATVLSVLRWTRAREATPQPTTD